MTSSSDLHHDRGAQFIEGRLSAALHARLPGRAATAAVFWIKQTWAALFAILFLGAIVASAAVWQEGWALARYDALVLAAVAIQAGMLAFRLETWGEVKVIALFHLTGTVMEVFKLSQGSWDYPEAGVLEVGGVPLFTGFMYASIGSYLARAIRLFRVRAEPYPPYWATVALAVAIYANFFTHHYVIDVRLALFAATVAMFWRTRLWFDAARRRAVRMPVAIFLAAACVWVAENVGTATRTWSYPGQGQWDLVALGKLGSWYLLLYVAVVTVTLALPQALGRGTPDRDRAGAGIARQRG